MSEARSVPPPDAHEPEVRALTADEALREEFHLAAEFEDYLQMDKEYGRARSDTERLSLISFKAHTFIRGKVERMPAHLRRGPAIPEGVLHSCIVSFNDTYKPGTPLLPSLQRERDEYISFYANDALRTMLPGNTDMRHPEILGTLRLYEHTKGLGRHDLADSIKALLAAYGRALEIVNQSGIVLVRSQTRADNGI